MAAHFLHVGKTGGTAIKGALRSAGLPHTPYGPLRLHRHRYTLADVPEGHKVFFCLRDPINRYLSGFYSRLRKGQPRFYYEWTTKEATAFEAFPTPQALAGALASDIQKIHRQAVRAMGAIRHVNRPIGYTLGSTDDFLARREDVVFIARQETLGADWPHLKAALGLPPELDLPADPERAHRGGPSEDRSLDEAQRRALTEWYATDYELLDLCERLRRERGWAPDPNDAPSSGVHDTDRTAAG
jgi:hypothetical protein